MIKVDRTNGQNYAENLIDSVLLFNSGTWTVASGTGTTSLVASSAFVGDKSLLIENNTVGNNITATNTTQSTVIPVDEYYQLSFYVKKSIELESRSGAVLIYKNAALLDTDVFTIGSDDAETDVNDTWVRFQCNSKYRLSKDDVITLQFRLDAETTTELTTFIYIDGVMLNKADRENRVVPFYTKPDEYKYLKDIPTLPSADGNYQLTVSSGVYSWTEIV